MCRHSQRYIRILLLMFEVLTKDLMSKYQQDKLLADFLTNTNRAQCLVQPQHNALSFLPNPRNDNERRRRFLEPRCAPLGPSPLSIMRSSFQLDERYTKKKICGRGNHWSHWRTLTSWLIARTNGHDIVLGPSVKNAVGICVWSRRRYHSVKIPEYPGKQTHKLKLLRCWPTRKPPSGGQKCVQ